MLNKAILISACLLLTSQARATVITALNFNELPSEQGWTLVKSGPHANDAEGDLFSVSGGQLFQNTVGTGQGFSSSGSARYDFTTPSSFADADVITFFFTTRVTAHEDTRQDFSWASHFFSIYHDGQRAFAGIKPGELFANGTFFTPAGYDGGLTNSYQLSLFTNTNTFEFYLNGVLVRSGASTATTVADRFSIMDGTGTANADAVLSQFVAVSGTVVPEPSSLFGVFLASCALLRIGLRRRRVAA